MKILPNESMGSNLQLWRLYICFQTQVCGIFNKLKRSSFKGLTGIMKEENPANLKKNTLELSKYFTF